MNIAIKSLRFDVAPCDRPHIHVIRLTSDDFIPSLAIHVVRDAFQEKVGTDADDDGLEVQELSETSKS